MRHTRRKERDGLDLARPAPRRRHKTLRQLCALLLGLAGLALLSMAVWGAALPRRLDEAKMQQAARLFVGKHDFLALCAAGSSAAAHGDTVRTITDCNVVRKGDELEITVTADGYLYNMVRILAGTLCEAGAGRLDPETVPAILASRDRSKAGPTLPAQGLFLKCVNYN